MRSAARGKTVLYTSHILDVVERVCDRVIILHEGRVVADEKTADLMKKAGEPTLEAVFRSLTRSSEIEDLAGAFLDPTSRSK